MIAIVNWILSGLVGVLIVVLGYVIKLLIEKFQSVIESIQELTKTIVSHTEQLKYNEERITGLSGRLKVVEEDVVDIKLDCAKCKYQNDSHVDNNKN